MASASDSQALQPIAHAGSALRFSHGPSGCGHGRRSGGRVPAQPQSRSICPRLLDSLAALSPDAGGFWQWVGVMRCLACGAEMHLVQVAPDDTMMVPGYEHHTLQCSGCDEVERRLVFSREGASRPAEPVSTLAPPPASASLPAGPGSSLTAPSALAARVAKLVASRPAPRVSPSRSAEPAPSPAAPPPSASGPAEPASSSTTSPASASAPIASEADSDLDEGEALLRRAIEMLRAPTRGSQPAGILAGSRPDTPAVLADSMQAKGLPTSRVVQIHRDPNEAAYVAMDTKSGLSVLRHQDSARLRAMCDRIGWQVVDG
jgi:hypothetical protein